MSEEKRKKEEAAKPGLLEVLSEALEALNMTGRAFVNKQMTFNEAARLDKIRMSVKAALDAPLRNCDRYNDYWSAIEAWENACGPNRDLMYGYDFAMWLFKRSKGGAE